MRWVVRIGRWSLPTVLGGLLLCFGVLQAQELSLQGRVLDAAGQPLAGQEVVLHRVTPAGGAAVARATSGADGRFVLRVEGAGGPDALYFAATIYDGTLYIGTPFRGSVPPDAEYVLVVGGDSAAVAGLPGAVQAPGSGVGGGAGFAVLVAVCGLTGGLGLVVVRRRGLQAIRRQRELLIELAQLDERYGDRQGEADGAESEAYRQARAALCERLRSMSHAAGE
ncbi:MAG TPA: carboxypeptidase-like regulatory domain-containing protein [Longimicrobiales bacterium]